MKKIGLKQTIFAVFFILGLSGPWPTYAAGSVCRAIVLPHYQKLEWLGIASALGRQSKDYEIQERIVRTTPDFRKLKGLYQLALNYEDPSLTNRMRHTEMVAATAREISRQLGLSKASQALAGIIGLAHDIGHPIFSHDGQYAINHRLEAFGASWSHDASALRALSSWSDTPNYALTPETIEGIAKHGWRFDPQQPVSRTNRLTSDLPDSVLNRSDLDSLHLPQWSHLEGQVGFISDKIAYNTSDVIDGLRVGIFKLSEIEAHFPFAYRVYHETLMKIAETQHKKDKSHSLEQIKIAIESDPFLLDFVYRKMTPKLHAAYIENVVANARHNVQEAIGQGRLATADDLRLLDNPVVSFSPALMVDVRAFGNYCKEAIFPKLSGKLPALVDAVIDLILSGQFKMRGDFDQRLQKVNTEPKKIILIAEYLTREMTDVEALELVRTKAPQVFEREFQGYNFVIAPSTTRHAFGRRLTGRLALLGSPL